MTWRERRNGAESSIRVALLGEGWRADDLDSLRVVRLIDQLAGALARRDPEHAAAKERFIQGDLCLIRGRAGPASPPREGALAAQERTKSLQSLQGRE